MDRIDAPERIDRRRRHLFGAGALTLAAVELGLIDPAVAQSSKTEGGPLPATSPVTNNSFGSLKQIEAGVLSVGYADVGPTNGPSAILLHGWPYDIHSYLDVAPLLVAAGYRVIVPYLRGYGTTRFLSRTRRATANNRSSPPTSSLSWALSPFNMR